MIKPPTLLASTAMYGSGSMGLSNNLSKYMYVVCSFNTNFRSYTANPLVGIDFVKNFKNGTAIAGDWCYGNDNEKYTRCTISFNYTNDTTVYVYTNHNASGSRWLYIYGMN